MITNWKDMPIGVLQQMDDINSLHISDEEKTFKATALLAGMDYDEFLLLPLDDARELVAKTEFVKTEPKKVRTRSEYHIGTRTYTLFRNMMQITTSQYIDFQALLGQNIALHLPELMAICLVPKGHKYGDGYDLELITNEIRDYLNVEEALSIADFFIKKSAALIRRMQRRSEALILWAMITGKKENREFLKAVKIAMKLANEELLSEYGCSWRKQWPK